MLMLITKSSYHIIMMSIVWMWTSNMQCFTTACVVTTITSSCSLQIYCILLLLLSHDLVQLLIYYVFVYAVNTSITIMHALLQVCARKHTNTTHTLEPRVGCLYIPSGDHLFPVGTPGLWSYTAFRLMLANGGGVPIPLASSTLGAIEEEEEDSWLLTCDPAEIRKQQISLSAHRE